MRSIVNDDVETLWRRLLSDLVEQVTVILTTAVEMNTVGAFGKWAGFDVEPYDEPLLKILSPHQQGAALEHPEFQETDGCFAVTDDEIEEIWRLVPNGTKVVIKP